MALLDHPARLLLLTRIALAVAFYAVHAYTPWLGAVNMVVARHTYAPSLLYSPTIASWTRALPILLAFGVALTLVQGTDTKHLTTVADGDSNPSKWRQHQLFRRLFLAVSDVGADVLTGFAVSRLLLPDTSRPTRVSSCCEEYSRWLCLIAVAAAGALQVALYLLYRTLSSKKTALERIHDELHKSLHWARAAGYAVAFAQVLAGGLSQCVHTVPFNENDYIKSCGSFLDFDDGPNIAIAGALITTAIQLSLLLQKHERAQKDNSLAIEAQLQPFGTIVALWTCDAAASNRATEDVLVLTSVSGALLLASGAANAVNHYFADLTPPPSSPQ